MNTLRSVVVGTVPLLSTGVALAQNQTMMGGGAWGGGWMGGYGGGWVMILVAVVVVVLVAWIVQRNGK